MYITYIHGDSIKSKPNCLCYKISYARSYHTKTSEIFINIPIHRNNLRNLDKKHEYLNFICQIKIYEIIDNPLIHSRPHIQHKLLEIVYVIDCCMVDLLLHHALHFIIMLLQDGFKSGLFGGHNVGGTKSGV